jgi:hypothetical protein
LSGKSHHQAFIIEDDPLFRTLSQLKGVLLSPEQEYIAVLIGMQVHLLIGYRLPQGFLMTDNNPFYGSQ